LQKFLFKPTQGIVIEVSKMNTKDVTRRSEEYKRYGKCEIRS